MAMDKMEKEEIAVTQDKEEEMIAMIEDLQQVLLSHQSFLSSQVKQYSTAHSCKPGPSPPPTASASPAHTLTTTACLLQDTTLS